MAKSPEQTIRKWLANAQNAKANYQAGIQSVEQNPCTKAAARVEHWAAQVASDASKRKFVSKLNRISLDTWKVLASEKGGANYATGIRMGEPKMRSFVEAFIPYVARGRAQLPARGTFEDNMARQRAMAEWNARFRGQGFGAVAGAGAGAAFNPFLGGAAAGGPF